MFRYVTREGVGVVVWRQAGDSTSLVAGTVDPRKVHRALTGRTALLHRSYGETGALPDSSTVLRDNHRLVYSRGRLIRYGVSAPAVVPVPPEDSVGHTGSGGGGKAKHSRELDDLLAKALKKPVEVAVQILLPKSPSPEAIAVVISALETHDALTTKSVTRQVQSLLARLQVLEREAEEEEAVVMMLLLD